MLRLGLGAIALAVLVGTAVVDTGRAADEAAAEGGEPAMNKMLRHVVMFEFNEDSTEADIQGVVDAFNALPTKIPEIADYEYGTNNSPEGLNQGLTHIFLVTFKTEADRATYLPHPAHQAFVEVLKPHLKEVCVVDYWAQTP